MGILNIIEDLFPKKSSNGEDHPLKISTHFVPLRLKAKERNKVTLYIKVKNNTNEKQLISVDIKLSAKMGFGFDSIGRNKRVEKRLDVLEPGKEKEVAVDIYSNGTMQEGNYNIEIIAYLHDRSYDRVLRYVKKYESIRAV